MMAKQDITINDYNDSLMENNWLSLAQISYLDQRGVRVPRVWEDNISMKRNLKDGGKTSSVGVIAFYRRQLHFDCIILVKQFRPALSAYTIEMPSGLVEDNETVELAAIRGLQECTGFSGRIKKVGPVLAMDPVTSDSSVKLVTINVNGDDPMNVHMNTLGLGNKTSNDRFKEPLLIPVSELLDKLSAYAGAGFIVDSRINALAIGLVMGNNSRKSKIPTTLV